jgi:hypothetical protein
VGDHRTDERQPDASAAGSGLSRRGFLVGAAGLTGVAVSGVWRGTPARAADSSSAPGATPPGGFDFLELNGKIVGTVKSVDGGTPYADVIVEEPGPDGIARKHLGGVKYNEFTVKLGMGMSKPVYDWISSFMQQKDPPVSGAFIATDSDLNQQRRTDFSNALITEVGFPASDVASKAPGYLTLKFAPESTTVNSAKGKLNGRPSNQKLWLPSNFRLSIGDIDLSSVSRVEGYPVKWELSAEGVREPGKLEVPSLKITMPESDSKPLHDWFDDFVIKGNNVEADELIGLLDWRTPDLSKSLVSLNIRQIGINALNPDLPESHSDALPRVKAEMYCEEIKFNYKAGWA